MINPYSLFLILSLAGPAHVVIGGGSRVFDVPQMGQVELKKDVFMRVGVTIQPQESQEVMDTRGQLITVAKKLSPITRTLKTNLRKSQQFSLGDFIVEWTPKKWDAITQDYNGGLSIYKVGLSSLVGEHLVTKNVSGKILRDQQSGAFYLDAKVDGTVVDKKQFAVLSWSVQSPQNADQFKQVFNVAKKKQSNKLTK